MVFPLRKLIRWKSTRPEEIRPLTFLILKIENPEVDNPQETAFIFPEFQEDKHIKVVNPLATTVTPTQTTLW